MTFLNIAAMASRVHRRYPRIMDLTSPAMTRPAGSAPVAEPRPALAKDAAAPAPTTAPCTVGPEPMRSLADIVTLGGPPLVPEGVPARIPAGPAGAAGAVASDAPAGSARTAGAAGAEAVVSDPTPDTPQARLGKALLRGVHAANEFVDERPLLRASVHSSFALFRSLKAFPKFIYPTIHGATGAEKAFIMNTLDTLPLKDVATVKSLVVVPTIPHASGLAIPAQVTNVIKLARDQVSTSPEWFREVVIHEVGHTKDFDSAWFGVVGHDSSKQPWGEGPFVSNYAKTNHWEDYAEAHANYHMRPERLHDASPGKFDEMARLEQQGVLDRLIDRPAFRETGRFIGEHMGTDVSRNTVQALYWASSGIQVAVGLDHLRAATLTKDAGKHFDGMLTVAAGTLFGSRVLALGGLAVQGANMALKQGVARGDITADDADAAVRVVSDPVEKAVRGVGHRLGLTAAFEDTLPAKPAEDARLAQAAGIAVGGSVGALVGGVAGPYLGVLGGYAIGGPIGGTIGLVLGGLAGYTTGATVGGHVGGAIGRAVEHATNPACTVD